MSSRRTMTRSSSGEGRSSSHNGDDVSGSSRPSSRSYLSNVRPENSCSSHRYSQYRPARSTLCSVMAQLTEETQPSFETTLKSKAVSENCNVKFSCVVTGYPTPDVIWYKDDMQLDRYCGLPKYEIFRNGQNYSLHIYNCTVEDAAIYQASARNIKGIVSCSGVLEVGVMNEFKIHQRYFAKLKQKAENKRRELEGKENQGPGHQEQLRHISPDRSQRKRRSPMEAYLSTPSSTEDEGIEDSHEVPVAETEARLQETTMEEVKEKPGPITNGAVSPSTNGQTGNENGSMTYIYDSGQKTFTAHQPKTPFVKKKIKISKGVKAERVSEERRANEEASVALASTESAQSQGTLREEIMEVQSAGNSLALDSDSRKVTEQYQKSATEKAMPVYITPSEEEKLCVEGNVNVPSQKEQPNVPLPPGPGKHTAELQKEVGHKNTEENLKLQNPNPPVTPTQLQSSPAVAPQQPLSTVKKNISRTQQEDVTVMEVDKRSSVAEPQHKTIVPLMCEAVRVTLDSATTQLSNTSTDGTLAHRDLESVDGPCESKDALPQRPCEQSRDQLSEKETSPSPKNVSVSRPSLLNEVRQAHAQMNRNGAPVNLEPLTTRCDMDAQSPQRSPSGREPPTDDNQTLTLHSPVRAASDKMTQGTWDHSRGSNESHTVLFTGVQKSPLESPSDGENGPGCNISLPVQQSHVETAIKTVEGTEIQVDEDVEGTEVGKVQADNLASNERMVEMETESVAVKTSEQGKPEKSREAAEKGIDIVDVSDSETEKNEPVLKRAEETHPESQSLKLTNVETVIPHKAKTPENTRIRNPNESEQQIKGFKEIPTQLSKVISIAELLRSQMRALDSTAANSVTSIPIPADHAQPPPTTAAQKSQELRFDHREYELEVKKSKLDRKTETNTHPTPPTNLKAAHSDFHHRPTKTDHEQMQSLNAISPSVEALQNPFVSPSISVIDTGSTLETRKLLGSTQKYDDHDMDTVQESRASIPVPLKDGAVVSLSRTEHVQTDFSPITPKQELTNRLPSSPKPSVIITPEQSVTSTVIEKDSVPLPTTKVSSQDSMSISECRNEERFHGEDKGLIQNLTPEIKLISETHLRSTETDSAKLLEQHKEVKTTTSGSQNIQTSDTKSVIVTETQGITLPQESSLSMVEAFSKTDSLTPPNTEASPLLRKRNGSSAIPSATPQELASGARRKILIPKPKTEEGESTSPDDNQPQKEEVSTQSSKLSPVPVPGTLSVSPGLSRRSPLLQPSERTSPVERRSPLLSRKKVALETPTPSQEPTQLNNSPKTEGKPAEKDKHDPFKAPQVIRKIRGESFSDASGHLKLWCQFFNILSDSTIQWYRDEVEIAQVIRSAGDETQVNLAIVQASSRDCGVYGCTITNEHGTDSTDFLLSVDILAGMSLREDLGVGEEIEMIPLLLNKGVADPGVWGNKFFGRIMMQESRIGNGVSHKVWRAKVIYGLEPVFESGTTCIIKARNPITYGGKGECGLIERNLDITKEECRIQNLAREYCKIFSAEARVIENFGPTLEVIPVYLIYRPANTIPHATVGVDLKGVYLKYSLLDHTGRLVMRTGSEVEQKCCALQHWIHQWTNGNLLLTQLEGVETKITQVGISIKSTGYQGLSATGNPKVFEQFVSQHQCNYFCGLLSLRSLKAMDSLMTPSKPKSSRSPLLQRKMAAGSSSPQTGRKAAGSSSPQTGRKAAGSSSPQTGRKAAGSSSPQTGRKAAGSSSPQTGRKAAVSPRLPRKSESVQDNNKASTK